LTEEQRRTISEVVGIGGLKYADLMQNRTSDYKFSYEKMLAKKGNTATYLQYSYARVQSIFRKAEINAAKLRESGEIIIEDDKVRAVVIDVLRFNEALSDVTIDYQPNMLTSYLFDLTQKFFTFYEDHSVLHAETPLLRESRALVCDLVGRTIQTGLQLLGIQTVDKM
jgi:arginyl-tRNA synthetase